MPADTSPPPRPPPVAWAPPEERPTTAAAVSAVLAQSSQLVSLLESSDELSTELKSLVPLVQGRLGIVLVYTPAASNRAQFARGAGCPFENQQAARWTCTSCDVMFCLFFSEKKQHKTACGTTAFGSSETVKIQCSGRRRDQEPRGSSSPAEHCVYVSEENRSMAGFA